MKIMQSISSSVVQLANESVNKQARNVNRCFFIV